jgi:hypothetical protein
MFSAAVLARYDSSWNAYVKVILYERALIWKHAFQSGSSMLIGEELYDSVCPGYELAFIYLYAKHNYARD